ncbi:MAG: phosphotransferase family protein [Microthrixaceae bacterium]
MIETDGDPGTDGGPAAKVTRSARDHDVVRADLQRWLRARPGVGADATITRFDVPEANGMSSETILFDALLGDAGSGDAVLGGDPSSTRRLVARIAPAADAFPVFENYDLTRQFETIRRVAERSSVPVPEMIWDEPDPSALGAPFIVMERVEGSVPPDVMPYTFGDNWLADATPEQQRTLVHSTVEVLASLHSIVDPGSAFGFLRSPAGGRGTGDGGPETGDGGDGGPDDLRRSVDESKRWLEWATDGEGSPLLSLCFDWLEANWPANPGPSVLNWGDARIGNVLYREFRPVAVLDWEMATMGPRELDLAWLIFLHRFFDDLAVDFGYEGMPDLLRRDEVEALYESATGYTPQDMDWYLMYAATRHGIVFTRTSRRAAHFGDAPMPDDPDDAIMHRKAIEAMLIGQYWRHRR